MSLWPAEIWGHILSYLPTKKVWKWQVLNQAARGGAEKIMAGRKVRICSPELAAHLVERGWREVHLWAFYHAPFSFPAVKKITLLDHRKKPFYEDHPLALVPELTLRDFRLGYLSCPHEKLVLKRPKKCDLIKGAGQDCSIVLHNSLAGEQIRLCVFRKLEISTQTDILGGHDDLRIKDCLSLHVMATNRSVILSCKRVEKISYYDVNCEVYIIEGCQEMHCAELQILCPSSRLQIKKLFAKYVTHSAWEVLDTQYLRLLSIDADSLEELDKVFPEVQELRVFGQSLPSNVRACFPAAQISLVSKS